MSKRARILLAIAIAVFLMLHVVWLFWLFPNIPITGIFYIPFIFFLNVGVGVAAYFILKSAGSKKKTTLFSLAIIIPVMLIQIMAHPSNVSPIDEMGDYWTTFWRYPDDIQYEDLVYSNEATMLAAMVKYQDELPDRTLIFRITDNRTGEEDAEWYYIEFRDDALQYDADKIQLEEAGNETLLIINPGGPDEKEGYLDIKLEYLLNLYYESISEGYDGQYVYYYMRYFEEIWTYRSGAERLFTLSLRLFR
jgi:hypothetical protein